jgi:hypothetical protein
MTLAELDELHYISPIANLRSIVDHGIVSHELAERLKHESVAMPEIQDRRAHVVLPNRRKLHSYVNLYINARNKMMFKLKEHHAELCVLQIESSVVELPGAVVTDQNAASDRVRFSAGIDGLKRIDRDYVFAKYWNHRDDQVESWRHGSAMCAEVLVPDSLPSRFISGFYVSCSDAANLVRDQLPDAAVTVSGHMFFQ